MPVELQNIGKPDNAVPIKLIEEIAQHISKSDIHNIYDSEKNNISFKLLRDSLWNAKEQTIIEISRAHLKNILEQYNSKNFKATISSLNKLIFEGLDADIDEKAIKKLQNIYSDAASAFRSIAEKINISNSAIEIETAVKNLNVQKDFLAEDILRTGEQFNACYGKINLQNQNTFSPQQSDLVFITLSTVVFMHKNKEKELMPNTAFEKVVNDDNINLINVAIERLNQKIKKHIIEAGLFKTSYNRNNLVKQLEEVNNLLNINISENQKIDAINEFEKIINDDSLCEKIVNAHFRHIQQSVKNKRADFIKDSQYGEAASIKKMRLPFEVKNTQFFNKKKRAFKGADIVCIKNEYSVSFLHNYGNVKGRGIGILYQLSKQDNEFIKKIKDDYRKLFNISAVIFEEIIKLIYLQFFTIFPDIMAYTDKIFANDKLYKKWFFNEHSIDAETLKNRAFEKIREKKDTFISGVNIAPVYAVKDSKRLNFLIKNHLAHTDSSSKFCLIYSTVNNQSEEFSVKNLDFIKIKTALNIDIFDKVDSFETPKKKAYIYFSIIFDLIAYYLMIKEIIKSAKYPILNFQFYLPHTCNSRNDNDNIFNKAVRQVDTIITHLNPKKYCKKGIEYTTASDCEIPDYVYKTSIVDGLRYLFGSIGVFTKRQTDILAKRIAVVCLTSCIVNETEKNSLNETNDRKDLFVAGQNFIEYAANSQCGDNYTVRHISYNYSHLRISLNELSSSFQTTKFYEMLKELINSQDKIIILYECPHISYRNIMSDNAIQLIRAIDDAFETEQGARKITVLLTYETKAYKISRSQLPANLIIDNEDELMKTIGLQKNDRYDKAYIQNLFSIFSVGNIQENTLKNGVNHITYSRVRDIEKENQVAEDIRNQSYGADKNMIIDTILFLHSAANHKLQNTRKQSKYLSLSLSEKLFNVVDGNDMKDSHLLLDVGINFYSFFYFFEQFLSAKEL